MKYFAFISFLIIGQICNTLNVSAELLVPQAGNSALTSTVSSAVYNVLPQVNSSETLKTDVSSSLKDTIEKENKGQSDLVSAMVKNDQIPVKSESSVDNYDNKANMNNKTEEIMVEVGTKNQTSSINSTVGTDKAKSDISIDKKTSQDVDAVVKDANEKKPSVSEKGELEKNNDVESIKLNTKDNTLGEKQQPSLPETGDQNKENNEMAKEQVKTEPVENPASNFNVNFDSVSFTGTVGNIANGIAKNFSQVVKPSVSVRTNNKFSIAISAPNLSNNEHSLDISRLMITSPELGKIRLSNEPKLITSDNGLGEAKQFSFMFNLDLSISPQFKDNRILQNLKTEEQYSSIIKISYTEL